MEALMSPLGEVGVAADESSMNPCEAADVSKRNRVDPAGQREKHFFLSDGT